MNSTNVRPLGYSVLDAAGVAGVSRAHLYRAMHAGELPSVKTGSRRVILHDDLVAWLQAQREIAVGVADRRRMTAMPPDVRLQHRYPAARGSVPWPGPQALAVRKVAELAAAYSREPATPRPTRRPRPPTRRRSDAAQATLPLAD